MQKILQDVSLGKNIQKIRISKCMTQADVTREMQLRGRLISVNHYGHIEQGRKNIFVADLIMLKEIFNVDYDEFFKGLVSYFV